MGGEFGYERCDCAVCMVWENMPPISIKRGGLQFPNMETRMNLPPWPVDDQSLELLHRAVRPGEDAERSSLEDICRLFSEMAGSDTGAVEETVNDVTIMRDPQYSPQDVIAALVEEIWRLRGRTAS